MSSSCSDDPQDPSQSLPNVSRHLKSVMIVLESLSDCNIPDPSSSSSSTISLRKGFKTSVNHVSLLVDDTG